MGMAFRVSAKHTAGARAVLPLFCNLAGVRIGMNTGIHRPYEWLEAFRRILGQRSPRNWVKGGMVCGASELEPGAELRRPRIAVLEERRKSGIGCARAEHQALHGDGLPEERI